MWKVAFLKSSHICLIVPTVKKLEILWSHIVNLYYKNCSEILGISIVPKLKYEHIKLTSHSKMRVDLATQVINKI